VGPGVGRKLRVGAGPPKPLNMKHGG
jgi:hypothetical protein